MDNAANDAWLAGIDGCRGGWLTAFVRPSGGDIRLRVFSDFGAVLAAPEQPRVIAIDIPIGLPERAGRGGREAENSVRPLLGARQSSVFSVPSRAAFSTADYREACALAQQTSEPPRKISKQLFMIAPKIREVDESLRGDASLRARVFEVHPEVAFWRLNTDHALDTPKKIKGRPNPAGLALRRALLIRDGMPVSVVEGPAPRGAAEDDLLDALACAAVARRIHAGLARPFPDPPPRDVFGLRMAIWA